LTRLNEKWSDFPFCTGSSSGTGAGFPKENIADKNRVMAISTKFHDTMKVTQKMPGHPEYIYRSQDSGRLLQILIYSEDKRGC
jgi:hypothetical protein